jgi:hypothetical protein
MEETEEFEHSIRPPNDGYVSAHDAELLMVAYQNLSVDYGDHYANATYYKENARFKRDSAFNLAFMKSEAKSDKSKDIEAKNDPSVRIADILLSEAAANLKLVELKYESAVRAYHAMKKICEVAHEERKFL